MLATNLPEGFFSTTSLGLDLETTCRIEGSPDPHRDKTLLVSLGNGTETIVLEPGPWLPTLFETLSNKRVTVIAHNAEFDLRFLRALGYDGHVANLWDTMIVEQLLTAGWGERVGLGPTVWRRLSRQIDKTLQKSFTNHKGNFTPKQIEYSRRDAEILPELMKVQRERCRQEGLMDVTDLENRLVPVVADMEWRGVGFDLDRWEELKTKELEQAGKAERELAYVLELPCYTLNLFGGVSTGINFNSPQQVLCALNHAGVNVSNTGESILVKYKEKHPESIIVLNPLIDYKKCMKRIGFGYDKYVNPVTSRIHTHYKQCRARTGRFSSTNPNLQNVPKSQYYRSLFVAAPGCVLITADYAQQEMRILAYVAKDKALKHMCMEGDVYLAIARNMFSDPSIQKSDNRRDLSKGSGLAMAYGAGAETIAETSGVSYVAAEKIVAFVRETFPNVTRWAKKRCQQAVTEGWVQTLSGRKRWFPPAQEGGNWATEPRNTPIQGTAADMLKLAMVYVDETLRKGGYKSRIVLTVHDELVIEAPEEEAKDVAQIVELDMMRAGEYYVPDIPMPVDVVTAKDWRK